MMPKEMSSVAMQPAQSAAAVKSESVENGVGSDANHDADWEEFQAFVAQVEQSEERQDGVVEPQDVEDEGAAREAEESLENMQYVDRYRQALEQASAPQVGGREDDAPSGRKRERQADPDASGDEEEEDLTAIVREAAAGAAKRRRVASASNSDAESEYGGDSDNDSLEDLTNWRSKGH